jgi:hypothetical protein
MIVNFGLMLDRFPLGWLFILTVIVVLISIAAGFQLARYTRRRSERAQDASVGVVVGATLGLLAFTLAFTFGMTASRFDTRRQLVLDESNAIGTTFLRAALLPEPHRSEVRKLLGEYAGVRVEAFQQPQKLQQTMVRSEALLDRLWVHAVAAGEKDPRSVPAGLFIQSMNLVIDLHAKRITVGTQYRIQGSIWFTLYFVAILSMAAVGYNFGLTDGNSYQIIAVLVLAFSAVILLIADLDRAGEGALRVSQQPMIELQRKLEAPAP